MAKVTYKIIWTDGAKEDLKDIYNFVKTKSLQGAKNVITDIKNAPKSVHFSQQNETEVYNPQYMRIVVRNYKILYKINDYHHELIVYTVYDTRQNPDGLSNKEHYEL